MNNIWAPWRIKYIETMVNEDLQEKGCIFCGKQDKEDHQDFVLKRGQHSFVILNIYPYNNGHLLFAPYDHIADISDFNKEQILEIFSFINLFKKRMSDRMNCDGFNVGVNIGKTAGAGVEDHVHFHLVPRWNGDTNFMPVITDTKVIPQALEQVWELLEKE
ncbi:MAG: HIT domain-containing protein [Candidatus Aureabacteria bacterium]|nr:HIT domain-containing protein [Candidatus Auribacterota bacterium]